MKAGEAIADMVLYGDIHEAPWPESFPLESSITDEETLTRCHIAASILALVRGIKCGSCTSFDAQLAQLFKLNIKLDINV